MFEYLTASQQRVFSFYEKFIKDNKRPPTYEESGKGLEVSPSVVYNHIKVLEKKGYLRASSKKEGRGVEIYGYSKGVPVIGEIACGKPIHVYEEAPENIDVPKGMCKGNGPFYALYARGFSMIKVGVSDHDILIIRKQDDVNDGDIAVVILGDSEYEETATLKRVFKKNNSILLKPENDEFDSIMVDNCKIRGKMIGRIQFER